MKVLPVTLLASMSLGLLSACSDTAEEDRKAQERANQKTTLEKKRQEQAANEGATLSKGATLLSSSKAGEVIVETYEVPRYRYVAGYKMGVTKDICVVYTRRGAEPLMDCYRTEAD